MIENKWSIVQMVVFLKGFWKTTEWEILDFLNLQVFMYRGNKKIPWNCWISGDFKIEEPFQVVSPGIEPETLF